MLIHPKNPLKAKQRIERAPVHTKRCPRQPDSAKECTHFVPPDTGPSANETYPTYLHGRPLLTTRSELQWQRRLKPGVPPDSVLLHMYPFAHWPLRAPACKKNLKRAVPLSKKAPTKVDSMQTTPGASARGIKCANFSDKLRRRLPNGIRISIRRSRQMKHSPN